MNNVQFIFAFIAASIIAPSFAGEIDSIGLAVDSAKPKMGHANLEGEVYDIIFPRTEVSIGFQAPIFHGGRINSQLNEMYPDQFNDFYTFNYGFGFYFSDVIGFAYQKALGGSYHVANKLKNQRDKISIDYDWSQWLIGGRVNISKPFFTSKYEIILGYHHGFINTIYTSSDSTFNTAITGSNMAVA